jgi:hypothetical protein
MKADSFIARHYLVAGESVTTHAAAVLIGVVLMAIGAAAAATVALLPVGVVIALLGLLIFGGGIFAHIQSPVTFRDMLDTVVSLAGMAISMTFTLAVALFIAALGVSALWVTVEWLRSLV